MWCTLLNLWGASVHLFASLSGELSARLSAAERWPAFIAPGGRDVSRA